MTATLLLHTQSGILVLDTATCVHAVRGVHACMRRGVRGVRAWHVVLTGNKASKEECKSRAVSCHATLLAKNGKRHLPI